MTEREETIEEEVTKTETREVEVEVPETRKWSKKVVICDACGADASESLEFEFVDVGNRIEEQHDLHGWHKNEDTSIIGDSIHICPDCAKNGIAKEIAQADTILYNSMNVSGWSQDLEETQSMINKRVLKWLIAATVGLGAVLWFADLISVVIYLVGIVIGWRFGIANAISVYIMDIWETAFNE